MDWPNGSDFSLAMQKPQWAFSDPNLKTVEIEKNDNRQPRPRSGQFATVFKGTYPKSGEMVAIRIFSGANSERRERYKAISDFLSNKRLESLVQFNYCEDGIKAPPKGKRFPLVTMDWVRGNVLFDWAQDRCDNQDAKSIAKICDLWLNMIHELRAAKIAHGDLQHANVMITDDGRLKLVDYDCMCVPALVGRRNLEIGVEPYQHPDRDNETLLNLNLDNFSALFIFVALRALAAAPNLWATYVQQPKYDKMLFRKEDLQTPGQSALIQSLHRSPDKEVQRLTKELLAIRASDIDQVPPLENVLFSYANVESLLNQRDFDAALELLDRNKKSVADVPPALQPRLQNAEQRVKLRLELEQAIQKGDETAMARSYAPQLLDDYPRAANSVKVARDSQKVIPILKRLEQAKQGQKWRDLVLEWNTHQSLLASRKSAAPFVPLAKMWQERNQACDALLQLLKPNSGDPAHIAAAWERLQRLGGHPESDAFRGKIDEILERERAWRAFTGVSNTLSEQVDKQLVSAWNETLFAGWSEAEAQRPRVNLADRRLKILKQIQTLTGQPISQKGDDAIGQLAANLPSDYQYSLSPQVALAQGRFDALQRFLECLAHTVSDIALDAAWRRLEQLQGTSLVAPNYASRVSLAQQRMPLLKQLKQIPADYPAQQAAQWDPKLLAIWNADLLADCLDAAPWGANYQKATQRKKVLHQLRSAITSGNKLQISELSADPSLKNFSLPPEWTKAIKLASAEVAVVRKLIDAIKGDDPARLRAAFDAKAIRKNSAAFNSYRDKLQEWMRTEIVPAKKILLGPPLARQGVVKESRDALAFKVAWNWPEPRFCDECVLAVVRRRPEAADDLASITTQLRLRVDRHSFEEGGGSRVLHADAAWAGCYVVVWAVVDLGFAVFNSEAVLLGRLEFAAAAKKKSFFG